MVNIYCDESCHLQLSKNKPEDQKSMVIGGISCDKDLVKDICRDIRELKIKHGLDKFTEIKWTKVSNNKFDFYKELIEYFFENNNLSFRAIVFQDKSKFDYTKYSHDELYYIMYFYLLREMIYPNIKNSIYIDKKDTNGGNKVKILKECLCKQKLDFTLEIIERIQIIDSKDSELMQLSDLLIGAVSYANRYLDQQNKSVSKKGLVELIREKTGYNLLNTTLRREQKFNLFMWKSECY